MKCVGWVLPLPFSRGAPAAGDGGHAGGAAALPDRAAPAARLAGLLSGRVVHAAAGGRADGDGPAGRLPPAARLQGELPSAGRAGPSALLIRERTGRA